MELKYTKVVAGKYGIVADGKVIGMVVKDSSGKWVAYADGIKSVVANNRNNASYGLYNRIEEAKKEAEAVEVTEVKYSVEAPAKKDNKNLLPVISELHKAFDLLNKHFYDNKLPEVVLAIRSQGKRKGVMGWFSVSKVWTDGAEVEKHEIVITAETLNRPMMDIMRTLHHEMIHLYCSHNGIEDTSRKGAYHNKNFRDACLQHGFYYADNKPDSKIGWSYALLKPETEAIIESWGLDAGVFGIARISFGDGEEKKKKPSNIIKWTCPSCSAIIRSSKLEGIRPFCMNDKNEDGTEKDACATMFIPEIPEGFIGKIGGEDEDGDTDVDDDTEASVEAPAKFKVGQKIKFCTKTGKDILGEITEIDTKTYKNMMLLMKPIDTLYKELVWIPEGLVREDA